MCKWLWGFLGKKLREFTRDCAGNSVCGHVCMKEGFEDGMEGVAEHLFSPVGCWYVMILVCFTVWNIIWELAQHLSNAICCVHSTFLAFLCEHYTHWRCSYTVFLSKSLFLSWLKVWKLHWIPYLKIWPVGFPPLFVSRIRKTYQDRCVDLCV